jgi:arsenite-transporting ATPase
MNDARTLLFTGKGGVGKTTVAAATAVRCADRGARTLLLSTDAAHSVSDALAVPLGPEPTAVTERLSAVQIDTQRRFEAAWSDVQFHLVELLARGGVDPITAEELTVLPGIDEVLALLAVREYADSGDWDVLVVDCAPTAETLRLLALPEALNWYLNKVFPLQRRMMRGMRPIASLLGRGDALPPDMLFDALLRLNGELAAVREMLSNPERATVRLVLTPERVAESRRTFTALSLYGYLVDMVVANRIFPAGDDDFRRGWTAAQEQQLVHVAESFQGLTLGQVSYQPGEPVGVEELRSVASELYGDLDPDEVDGKTGDPLALPSTRHITSVVPDGDEYVLRLELPFVDQGSVEATRIGDDLILTVEGHRRVLALPSVLRRCDVVGGDVVDGELRVRFVPDRSLWPQISEATA